MVVRNANWLVLKILSEGIQNYARDGEDLDALYEVEKRAKEILRIARKMRKDPEKEMAVKA